MSKSMKVSLCAVLLISILYLFLHNGHHATFFFLGHDQYLAKADSDPEFTRLPNLVIMPWPKLQHPLNISTAEEAAKDPFKVALSKQNVEISGRE